MHRREADEPRVILVFLAADFLFCDDLRCAGLATRVDLARKAYAARGTAFVHDAPHSVVHCIDGELRELYLGRRVVIVLHRFDAGLFCFLEKVRLMKFAADDNSTLSSQQLNRSHRYGALPDGSEHCVKILPLRIARICAPLPFAARYDSSDLSRQIDAGSLSHSKPGHPIMNHIHTHL